MRTAIATVCLSGTLTEKLDAIAAARFKGVEIFENDLLSFDGTPRDARRLIEDLGLAAITFQRFRGYAGAAAIEGLRPGRAQVRPHAGARLRPPDGLQQRIVGVTRRDRA